MSPTIRVRWCRPVTCMRRDSLMRARRLWAARAVVVDGADDDQDEAHEDRELDERDRVPRRLRALVGALDEAVHAALPGGAPVGRLRGARGTLRRGDARRLHRAVRTLAAAL